MLHTTELKIVVEELEENEVKKVTSPYISVTVPTRDEDGRIIGYHERRDKIGDSGVKEIAYALKRNISLEELDLSKEKISNSGADSLVKALVNHPSIKKLILRNNSITSFSEIWLELLERNKNLQILDVSHNKIKAKGIEYLANSLATNTCLTTLDLSHNKLKNEGIKTIARTMKINRGVQTLILSWNNFNTKAVEYFNEKALKENCYLKVVELKCVTLNPIKQVKASQNTSYYLAKSDKCFNTIKKVSQLYFSSRNNDHPSSYLSKLPESTLLSVFSILSKNMMPTSDFKEVKNEIENIFDNAQFPEIFINQFPEHPLGKPKLIPIKKIISKKISGKFNYVVTEKGELIIGKAFDKPGGGHIDLAKGQPIQAAGAVKFYKGKIKYIDNSSGHYLPYGIHARKAALHAFSKHKFTKKSPYIEKIWQNTDPSVPTIGKWIASE